MRRCYIWCLVSAVLALVVSVQPADLPNKTQVKAADFILLVEVTIPNYPNYLPTANIQQQSATVKIQHWIGIVVKSLLLDARSKVIDARVVVYMVDATKMDDPATQQREFYSRQHYGKDEYFLHGLVSARTKRFYGSIKDRYTLTRKIEEIVGRGKVPANRTRVPTIFIWHVPYELPGTWAIKYLRQTLAMRDVVVTFSDYWSNNTVTRIFIEHDLLAGGGGDPKQLNWMYPSDQKNGPIGELVDAIWKIANSCRTFRHYSPCYYLDSSRKECAMYQEFKHEAIGEKFLKYCFVRSAERLNCTSTECIRWCNVSRVNGSCSAPCGVGVLEWPAGTINKYNEHCPPVLCFGRICGVLPTHEKSPPTTTGPSGVELEGWMIALITILLLTLVTAVIGVTICAVRKRRRRRRMEGYRQSPAREYRSPRDRVDRAPRGNSRTDQRYSQQQRQYPAQSTGTGYSRRPSQSITGGQTQSSRRY